MMLPPNASFMLAPSRDGRLGSNKWKAVPLVERRRGSVHGGGLMLKLCRCAVPIVLAFASPVSLWAQAVGDRVRASLSHTRLMGNVGAVSDEGFELVQGEVRRFVVYGDVERLEWSAGSRRHLHEGFVIGASAGTVAGILAERSLESFGDRTLSGMAIGAVVGMVVGVAIKRESWSSEPLDDLVASLTDSHPQIAPGDRVRLSVSGNTLIGSVGAVSDEGFEFEHGGLLRSVAFRELDKLEVSSGTQPLRRARIWSSVLGGLAGLLGAAAAQSPECWTDITLCNRRELMWLTGGAASGAALGGGVGALFRGESWETLPLDHWSFTFSPIVAPQFGPEGTVRVGLGAYFKF